MSLFRRLLIRQGLSATQRRSFYVGCTLVWLALLLWRLDKLPIQLDSTPFENKEKTSTLTELPKPQAVELHVATPTKEQARLDYLAEKMQTSFELVTNFDGHKVRVNLQNTGEVNITGWGWCLYFYSQQAPLPRKLFMAKNQITFEHVNGFLQRLCPTEEFQSIPPGKGLDIPYAIGRGMAARTEFFPNWFVAAPGLEARVVKSTAGNALSYIKPFDSEAKWKRGRDDRVVPFSPQARMKRYGVRDFGSAESLIVPTPFHVSYDKSRSAVIDDTWVIVVQDGAGEEAKREAKLLSEKLGLKTQNDIPEDHYILLSLDGTSLTADQRRNPDEAYNLKSLDEDKEHILIAAHTSRGLFYGIQSLLNMMDLDTGAVFSADVQDVPRYPYRGLMLDVARNFKQKADVFRLIEGMAAYKLNKLHLHLADDEGWRLQIPGLEELTEVGVRKGFDLNEQSGLLPYLGSDPSGSVSGSGFYTVDDYKEILKYAHRHHVTVIPELDMPGHAHAAIKAMEARAQRLVTRSHDEDSVNYLLSDPKDQSEYRSVQRFNDSAINPCLESTYNFIDYVIKNVVEMHQGIQKLETFHFGGDEVPGGSFKASPACATFRKSNPSVGSLKDYFVERVYDILAKHELQPQGWEDAVYTSKTSLNTKVSVKGGTINAWYNIWENGFCYRTYETANAGFKVVLSHATHLYLDHPQEPDPEERGLFWATRYTDTKNIFNYSPRDIYSNMGVNIMGHPVDRGKECRKHRCIPLQKPDNVIVLPVWPGMEAALFGETVVTGAHLDYMVFPRLLALAERAWTRETWELEEEKDERLQKQTEDWAQFANALGYRELRRLEKLGIEYRLPVPGAAQEDGKLKVMSEFPGVPIQYSTDGGATWNDWKEQDDHTALSGRLLLASRSFDGKRRGRSTEVNL